MMSKKHMMALCAAVLGMSLVGSAYAASEQKKPSLDSQSYTWAGSPINTMSDTDRLPVDPKTGKRPGILDWEGAGLDVSRHPDKPGHDSLKCGICR